MAGVVMLLTGVLLGLVADYTFPYVHGLFHRLRHPLAMLTAGGLVLGVLGVIDGH